MVILAGFELCFHGFFDYFFPKKGVVQPMALEAILA
jgi:hypothetical protein